MLYFTSPDCNENSFLFSLQNKKDCNGKQELAPKKQLKRLQILVHFLIVNQKENDEH